MNQISLKEKEQIEIDFWKNSPSERPESDSLENIVNKMTDVEILLDCLSRFDQVLWSGQTILEFGAGQGWASCVLKRMYPNTDLLTTDISPAAVSSLPKWEHIFNVKVDNAYASRSYQIPNAENSIDIIFCFASAHHFKAHRRTLKEIMRILKPGGNAFYFYEPSTPGYLYWFAKWRVERKRPNVPEDILQHRKIQTIAEKIGFECRLDFFPNIRKRSPLETTYYYLLQKFPFLQTLLPCTINFHFIKPKHAS